MVCLKSYLSVKVYHSLQLEDCPLSVKSWGVPSRDNKTFRWPVMA